MAIELFSMLEPAVRAVGLELFDVEFKSGVVQVTVDRQGGVDLEALTDANRVVSALLDERDPIPGAYTLEVSSPGVERTLRTPAHFAKAVGETISVKTRPQVPGDRRLTGRLVGADEGGLELAVDGVPEATVRLAYSDIDRARTVFAWGQTARSGEGKPGAAATGAPKSGATKTGAPKSTVPSGRAAQTTTTTEQRKQVTTS
jgi:ribosome maturation factor RimP